MDYEIFSGASLSTSKRKFPLGDKIVLPTGEGYEAVIISEIIRCTGHGNNTIFSLFKQSEKTVQGNMIEYEKMLSLYGFFRIHKSCLINLNRISKFMKGVGGHLVMDDESVIHFTKPKKEEFFALFRRNFLLLDAD